MVPRSGLDSELVVQLDAPTTRRWVATVQAELRARRLDIDALNVFPIADSDTGTNLLLTWESAAAALPPPGPGDRLGDLLTTFARGALLGARGNSGVILCQLLRGFAAALPTDVAGAPELAAALARAADEAAAAVARPVAGTILSVASAAADAAVAVRDADAASTVVDVAAAAERAATSALARTPDQLPVLAEAGVVDAGGSGWLVILTALRSALEGLPVPDAAPLEEIFDRAEVPRPNGHLPPLHADVDSDGFGYEVQYLLAADVEQVTALRQELSAIGGSLVIVGGEDLWQVHIHVDDAGAAVEAGVRAGIPSRITVTRFAEPGAAIGPGELAGLSEPVGWAPNETVPPRRRATDAPPTRAVVAVVPGPGYAELFSSAGARTLIAAGTPSQPAVEDLVTGSGASEVIVISPDPATTAVAQAASAAIRSQGRLTSVVVVPTLSPVQGLAALAVADPMASLSDALVAMAEAAGATRVAEVLVANQTALTNVGTCAAGDALAMVGGDVVLIGPDLSEVAVGLLDRMLDGGGELVTLVTGEHIPADVVPRLLAHLETAYPLAEVTVYAGGQPGHPLLVGVE